MKKINLPRPITEDLDMYESDYKELSYWLDATADITAEDLLKGFDTASDIKSEFLREVVAWEEKVKTAVKNGVKIRGEYRSVKDPKGIINDRLRGYWDDLKAIEKICWDAIRIKEKEEGHVSKDPAWLKKIKKIDLEKKRNLKKEDPADILRKTLNKYTVVTADLSDAALNFLHNNTGEVHITYAEKYPAQKGIIEEIFDEAPLGHPDDVIISAKPTQWGIGGYVKINKKAFDKLKEEDPVTYNELLNWEVESLDKDSLNVDGFYATTTVKALAADNPMLTYILPILQLIKEGVIGYKK